LFFIEIGWLPFSFSEMASREKICEGFKLLMVEIGYSLLSLDEKHFLV